MFLLLKTYGAETESCGDHWKPFWSHQHLWLLAGLPHDLSGLGRSFGDPRHNRNGHAPSFSYESGPSCLADSRSSFCDNAIILSCKAMYSPIFAPL